MYDILIRNGNKTSLFGFAFYSIWAAELMAKNIRETGVQAKPVKWPIVQKGGSSNGKEKVYKKHGPEISRVYRWK